MVRVFAIWPNVAVRSTLVQLIMFALSFFAVQVAIGQWRAQSYPLQLLTAEVVGRLHVMLVWMNHRNVGVAWLVRLAKLDPQF